MKKIFTLIAAALIVCLTVFALASCGNDAVTIGENGNWFIGDTDTGVKAAGTDAEAVTIGQNGNWFIGTTDTGVKAVAGKYVVDTSTEVVVDNKWGKQYAVTTVTYSDGTTDTQKNLITPTPSGIYFYGTTSFVKGFEPLLMLDVSYPNGSARVPVTDDMIFGAKPDYNTPGTYELNIAYYGASYTTTVTVAEVADVKVDEFDLYYFEALVGTDASVIPVRIELSNGASYNVPLSSFTGLDKAALETAGEKELKVTYGGLENTLTIDVYDPEVDNISDAYFSAGTPAEALPCGADVAAITKYMKDNFVGNSVSIDFYEKMYGLTNSSVKITEDMLDYSNVKTDAPGRYTFDINVEIEGVGSATAKYYVSVEPNMTGANLLKSYYPKNSMLSGMLGNIEAYDNGYAFLTGSGGSFAAYTLDGNKVTAKQSGMTLYYIIDNTNSTYEVYVPAGDPAKTYKNADINMKISVYTDTVVISMYQPAAGSSPEVNTPVYSMPKSVIVDGKIDLNGSIITLNDADNSITMSY